VLDNIKEIIAWVGEQSASRWLHTWPMREGVWSRLEVDNGVFVRDEETANLAREVVRECVALMDRLDMGLGESELGEEVIAITVVIGITVAIGDPK
jgi:hypothetical protein